MACKHAALAAIYAKQMAEMDEPWKLWEVHRHDQWEKPNGPFAFYDNCDYRQIPKTIRIGNYDVPEPMRVRPSEGTKYYYIDATEEDGAHETNWSDTLVDDMLLKRNIGHLSRENCIIHAKALFSFSEVK